MFGFFFSFQCRNSRMQAKGVLFHHIYLISRMDPSLEQEYDQPKILIEYVIMCVWCVVLLCMHHLFVCSMCSHMYLNSYFFRSNTIPTFNLETHRAVVVKYVHQIIQANVDARSIFYPTTIVEQNRLHTGPAQRKMGPWAQF